MSNISCKELSKNIEELEKQKAQTQESIKEFKNDYNKYSVEIEGMGELSDDAVFDMNPTSLKISQGIINDYDNVIKSMDVDDKALGADSGFADPRHHTDIETTVDNVKVDVNYENFDVFKNLLDTETVGKKVGDKFLYGEDHGGLAMHTLSTGEFIANHPLPEMRMYGFLVNTTHRTKDGKHTKNILTAQRRRSIKNDKLLNDMWDIDKKRIKEYKKNGGHLKVGSNHIRNDEVWNRIYEDADYIGRGGEDLSLLAYQDEAYVKLVTGISNDYDPIYKQLLKDGYASQHEYFQEIGEIPENYRPVIYDADSIGKLNDVATEESIINSFKNLILDNQPHLAGFRKKYARKDYVDVIAAGMWDVIKNNAYGLDEISHIALPNNFTAETLDAIERQMGVLSMEHHLIEEFKTARKAIEKQLTKKPDRSRMDMNHLGDMNLIDKDTGEAFSMKFTDLIETNSRKLLETYGTKSNAYISIGETALEYDVPDLLKMNFFSDNQRKVLKAIGTTDSEGRNAFIKYTNFIEDNSLSRPPRDFHKGHMRINRMMGNYFTSVMFSKILATMIIEIPKQTAAVGLKSWMKTVSNGRSISDTVKASLPNNGEDYMSLYKSAQYALGRQSLYAHGITQTVEGTAKEFKQGKNKLMNKLFAGSDKVGKFFSKAYGMEQFDTMLRQTSVASLEQRMGTLSKQGKLKDMSSEQSFLSNYLDIDDIKQIEKGYNKYGAYDRNGNLEGLAFKKWEAESPDSYRKLQAFLKKATEHQIQNPDFDTLPPSWQTPTVKTLTMFRAFPLHELRLTGAYQYAMRDVQALKTISGLTAMAAVSTYLHIQINAATQDNPDEYLRKMLEPRRFIANVMNRLPGSIIAAPILDTVYGALTGGEQLISIGAKGGVGIDAIPIVSFANSIANMASGQGSAEEFISWIPGGRHPIALGAMKALSDQ